MSIPPYKENFCPSPYGKTLEEYIRNTVIVDNGLEAKRKLLHFVWKLERKRVLLCDTSQRAVTLLLESPALLAKTQIVSLISWRNCVLTIRPNLCKFDAEERDVERALRACETDASILFVYLHEKKLYPFHSPADAMQWEEDNLHYFQTVRKTWRAEFEQMRKERIDALLDDYNQNKDSLCLEALKTLACE
ncbi:hypothetical protein EDM56_09215 [Brevibacillus fluminis]|uniref:Uncharacterized protein n=1 Tax=Brevibacillus fluminis TaxID=511487 RepID=A0A3M8DTH4_9BACL|nr:hypothetical protein [Brevibacillus fluminis]RNB90661.1 hypothetical protein EDM56_09215 [Brevibacillus fluminis]